jgi:hypothetical protein
MMDVNKFYRIENISDRVVLIFCTTYINPISYLPVIEKDLGEIKFSGKIIFDLLLANGYNSNRFVEADVIESKINRRSMKVIEPSNLDEFLLKKIRIFYKSNPDILEGNAILLDEEKYQLIHS